MLVGDAGYGALFLLLSGLARWRFRRAPAQPFALLTLMSVATIVWGVLTGTYFGITALPPLLERLRLDWLAEEQNLMLLCFLIGAIHLTVAHTWNAIHNRRSYQAVAQVGWIGVTWAMFFFVRDLVLGVPSPPFALPMLAVAVGLVVLFMTPLAAMKTDWFNHVMLPLTLVGNFMDVVSYVRLYAVGMASLALAQAFNDMAGGAGASLGAGLASALVLFLGHALNIVLSAMGVLVHGVRLNALEFSSHIGIQWSGLEYRPFAREHAAGGRAIRGP
jgi:V/A-type H+-transporting ATPase subunit I